MSGIIDLLKNLKSKQQENSIKNKNIQSHQNIFKGFFNQINRFAGEILTLKEPEVYTIAKENNIACKYQDIFVLTRDNNLTIGIELKGASYSALSLENELSFLDSRVSFFQKLNSNLELKIVIQKEKLDENTQEPLKSSNIFVNEEPKRITYQYPTVTLYTIKKSIQRQDLSLFGCPIQRVYDK